MKFPLIISLCVCVFSNEGLLLGAPTHLVDESPVSISTVGDGVHIIDFGRVSFGNLRITPIARSSETVTVHFGESFVEGRVDRKPPGTVRYAKRELTLDGANPVVVAPPADRRNTETDSQRHPPAILTPSGWDVVLPFRWVEVEGWSGELRPDQITRQSAFASTWDDDAAAFESSDEMLNQIWELCRYSIKATTFAGMYVDGDRERIPYEADSYLNQLSHYYTDNDVELARDTFDRLMKYRTWPTEWSPHMIFMAYADWMKTGDKQWLAPRYEALKAKLLLERVGAAGLVTSNERQISKDDIVDWPIKERDGYVRTELNTVVNAFHIRVLEQMAEMADALDKSEEAEQYRAQVATKRVTFNNQFLDAETGLYLDGIGTDHSSLHANLFPLAFGLVPDEQQARIADWLGNRGMQCSVYAAQYLMEALFENGAGSQAVALMTAPNDRSWRHMVESGTTITWEAWDQKYKPNQDWNHAWGAAPANLLPRYILGAESLTAGWRSARIRPSLAGLSYAKGKVPTPRGPVLIHWQHDQHLSVSIELPDGMSAQLELPVITSGPESGVFLGDQRIRATRAGERWILDQQVEGTHTFTVK